jgi:tetratricopeptide (TPR) repeat protein
MDAGILEEKKEFLSIAESYLERKLDKEALHVAESWLRRFPFDADATIVRCRALLKMGKLDEVNEILEEVENSISQLSRIYQSVGDICLDAGLNREAIKFYRKFVTLNHGSPAARELTEKLHSLEAIQPRAHAPEEEKTYNDFSSIAPDFYTLTLAELYIRQGHLDMALNVLNEILKRDENNQPAAEKLTYVRSILEGRTHEGIRSRETQNEEVIQELTRWLANLGRMRINAT